MNIFDRIRKRAYALGDRLDQAAGAPPRETDESRRLHDIGEVALSPAVVEKLDTEIAFQRTVHPPDAQ